MPLSLLSVCFGFTWCRRYIFQWVVRSFCVLVWYRNQLQQQLQHHIIYMPQFDLHRYVDWGTFACVKDCDEGLGGHCGGNRPDASLELFPSRNICCTAKLGWIPTAVCTGGVVPPPPSTCQTDSECKQVCQGGGPGCPRRDSSCLHLPCPEDRPW